LLSGSTALAQEELEVSFSPIGGVYEKETVVEMDAGDGATIYYTTDGSTPGSGSSRYRGPITVSKVKAFRAVAYKNGKRSKIASQTYVCDREYDLAVVSIITRPENLWDFGTGIYVEGCCADTIEPYVGANYWMDWEKRANIEMYDEEGELCFNQSVGINLFGGFSRMLPQKSLAIFARSRYGEKRINYQLFPELKEDKYKSFILRNSGGDFLRTHLRDAFMTQLAKPTGVAIQAYRPAVVFLNGEYWGIQNIREKISEHYLKSNFKVDKENVDILRHNGVKRHGYSANYKKLLAYLRTNDLSDDKKMDHLRSFMSVDDYVRYNIAEVYSDNRDAGGNIRYWRERTDSAQWRWVLYDLDLGLGNNKPKGYKRNTLDKFTRANGEAWPDPAWSTFIIRSLLKNEKVEHQYINTFADQLNTVYHADTANRLLDKMEANIDSEMQYHQKRWGSSYENWKHHLGIMRKFISLRPYYLRKHIMQKFDLKDTVNVSIQHPGESFCDMHFSSLDITKNYQGIYFTGVPIEIEVTPKHDYNFVGWEDDSEAGAKRTIVLTKDISLVPLFEPKKRSAQTDSLIFNELSFFQVEGDSTKDWVELFNNSKNSIDLSNWSFTDRSIEKGWKIPEGVIVKSKEFLVISQDLNSFRSSYSADSIKAIGDFDFGLSSKGELLKLYDQEGFIVDSLTYNHYPDIDSTFTLSLSHPDSSSSSLAAWQIESPNPSYDSKAYRDYLQHENDRAYWTKVFYIGGGGFFFILISGFMWRRYSKKKKANSQNK
jgi:CotH kinase protein/Fn3 associated/Lamin Tail Domain